MAEPRQSPANLGILLNTLFQGHKKRKGSPETKHKLFHLPIQLRNPQLQRRLYELDNSNPCKYVPLLGKGENFIHAPEVQTFWRNVETSHGLGYAEQALP